VTQPTPDLPDIISVQDLAAWRRDGAPHAVLDVREPHELAICALDGAIHIPMSQVPVRMAEIPADRPLAVMCHHGGRSQAITVFLRRTGRANATNLAGGIDAWSRFIDPNVARY
jgi:rhodanese-related sulfurtransferase